MIILIKGFTPYERVIEKNQKNDLYLPISSNEEGDNNYYHTDTVPHKQKTPHKQGLSTEISGFSSSRGREI